MKDTKNYLKEFYTSRDFCLEIGNLFLYVLGSCHGGCKGCQASISVPKEDAKLAIKNLKKFMAVNFDQVQIRTLVFETGGLLESDSLDILLKNKKLFNKLFSKVEFVQVNTPFTTNKHDEETIKTLIELIGDSNTTIILPHPVNYNVPYDNFKKSYIKARDKFCELGYKLSKKYNRLILIMPILLYNKKGKMSLHDYILLNKETEKLNIHDGAGTGFLNSFLDYNQSRFNQMKGVWEFFEVYAGLSPDGNVGYNKLITTTNGFLNIILDKDGAYLSSGTQYDKVSPINRHLDIDYCKEPIDVEKIFNLPINEKCFNCEHYKKCQLNTLCFNAKQYLDKNCKCPYYNYMSKFLDFDSQYAILTEDEILEYLTYMYNDESFRLFDVSNFKMAVFRDILTLYSPIYGKSEKKISVCTDHIFVKRENKESITPKVIEMINKVYEKYPHLFKGYLDVMKSRSSIYFGGKEV